MITAVKVQHSSGKVLHAKMGRGISYRDWEGGSTTFALENPYANYAFSAREVH